MRQFLRRLSYAIRRRRYEADLAEELDFHRAMKQRDLEHQGLDPRDAALATRRALGSVALAHDHARDVWIWTWLQDILQDVRYALRTLRRNPGFTLVAVLTLALGIGANTAIFSLLDGVMFKPLDVANADELLLLQNVDEHGPDPQLGIGPAARFSYPAFKRFARALPEGTSLAAMSRVAKLNVRVAERRQAVRVSGQLVSGTYFSMFRAATAQGRLIDDTDNINVDAHPVAVVSYTFWQQHLSAAPTAIGQPIVINGVPFIIIGITAQGFAGVWVDDATEIWIPVAMQHAVGYRQNYRASNGRSDEPWLQQDGIFWLTLVARAPADHRQQLRAALALEYRRAILELADARGVPEPKRREFLLANRLMLTSFERGLSGLRPQFASPLYVLSALCALVLVIACVNIANLLLARGVARSREIGIRVSVGASRRRLIRQLFTESVVLSLIGGATGIALGTWVSDALAAIALPAPYRLDTRVLGFSIALTCLTALLFGLLPAMSATRLDMTRATAIASKWGSRHSPLSRMRPLLAGQIGLAFVLTVGAALFGRTLSNLTAIDPGFDREHVISVWFNPSASGYATEQIPALQQRVRARAQSIPGVVSTALSSCALADGCRNSNTVQIEGYQPSANESVTFQLADVDAHYFDTVGMTIIEGRSLDERDIATGTAVAVVNETAVRRYFPDRSPLGRRLRLGRFDVPIVGVVRDARVNDLAEAPIPMAFVPLPASAFGPRVLQARVLGDPEAVLTEFQRSIAQAEPGLVIERGSTIERQVERNLTRQRLVAYLTYALDALALVMACVGLYGVLSYTVARRTNEIGIRSTLGASPADLLRDILVDSVRVGAIGIVFGLLLSLLSARAVRSMLFGVSPMSPWPYLTATVVLLSSALFAAYMPARRATKVDPLVALRCE